MCTIMTDICVVVWQKTTQLYKAVFLQLKNRFKKITHKGIRMNKKT